MNLSDVLVTGIHNLVLVPSEKGRHMEMKERLCYGLSFCREGQITYTHRGQRFVSDPDHALFLPQGGSYVLHGDKTGSFPVINFYCKSFPTDTFLSVSLDDPDYYLEQFRRMQEVYPRDRALALSIFYGILSRLAAPQREAAGFEEAKALIRARLSDPELSNALLARELGMSEVAFRKRFVRETLISPKQFILSQRLHRAKLLLATPSHSVTAVAKECGFSSVYSFCRAFRQKLGLTPSDYRKEQQNKGI